MENRRSLVTLLDEENLRDGILALRSCYPVCPICNRFQGYGERLFIRTYGMCQSCDQAHRPSIMRRKK